jgi:transposase InsO family protein
VHPDKVVLGIDEIEFIGSVVSHEGVRFTRERIDKVLQIPKPVLGKELKSFLGVANYFATHVRNYADIVRPLHVMIRNYERSRRLEWSQETTDAFEKIKEELNLCPQLYFLNDTDEVFLHTDASDYALGGYCFQLINGVEVPIYFISHSFTDAEIRWSTIEKECYAIVYCLQKLEYLLRDRKFVLRTDHRNLTFMEKNLEAKVRRWKLTVQDFDMTVEHIRGVDNIPADAFSRLKKKSSEVVHLIAHLTEPSQGAVNRLKDRSLTPEQHKLIRRAHNKVIGHGGVELTVARLHKAGVDWPYMRELVRYFIRRCPYCQKMTYLKAPIHASPFTVAALAPMQRINVDSIGPLPESKAGYKYILTIVDCFSRWVELYPLKTLQMDSTRSCFMNFFGRWGVSSQILTDNGTQFLNSAIDECLEYLQVESVQILAYSKQENSMVERVNREVQRHLKACIFEKNLVENWEEDLPLVTRIINSTRHQAIGVSPAQLIFGNAIDLDRNILVSPLDKSISAPGQEVKMSKWLSDRITVQAHLLTYAQERQYEKDEVHNSKSSHEPTVFMPGDLVLAEYHMGVTGQHRPPNKLMPHLKGPLQVVSRNGDHYEVDSKSGMTRNTEFYHVTNLRPYLTDDQFEDDDWVARRDFPSATVVSRIVDHGGDEEKKKTLLFRVRWDGLDEPDSDRWIPYREIRDNPKLHEYLRTKGLVKLIPDEHKFENEFPPTRNLRARRPRQDAEYGHTGRKRRQF